ncbi:MAG: glutamate--tRNA ligase [Cyclobacteriaceae bacterium]
MKPVRVRFAPSPTGPLHIGGVRTALYNYLFAKKMGGTLILRIEDTDQNRWVNGAEEYIVEALEWCNIEVDESPIKGGPFQPYRQSERKDIYAQYAQQLIDQGKAYYAFDTPEELDAMRQRLKEAKADHQQYNAITRLEMRNSLTLPPNEVASLLASGSPYVVRIKIPKKEEIRVNDMIRGWVKVHASTLDDKVILKSDGLPTYHLANVVDDHLMEITHVIRGEEWLPSAPLHVLLHRFLGWENEMPAFAHLPLILKPDGNGKLSKRDAEKHGYPIFPLDWNSGEEQVIGFRENGYLSEAFVNFLAFLGWNPGSEQELFSLEELIGAFSLERVGKSGAKFDIEKAKWFNQQYLKNKPIEVLKEYLKNDLVTKEITFSQDKLDAICELLRDRITFTSDLWEQGIYFFRSPDNFDQKLVRKKWNSESETGLTKLADAFTKLENFASEEVKNTLNEVLEQNEIPFGKVMQILRLAITGLGGGPDLMRIMELIGQKESVERIQLAITRFSSLEQA